MLITSVLSPWVHQMFPATPIYSTAPTAYFSHIMLMNAFRVMETNDEALFQQEAVELATQQMHQSLLNTETWYPSVGWLAGEVHSLWAHPRGGLDCFRYP